MPGKAALPHVEQCGAVALYTVPALAWSSVAQFVGGRYQLIAQLGGGGMADVYLAKMIGKSDFAKLAVVKRLKVNDAEDPEVAKMFADEARLCARLNHPNIVQTFEVGEDTEGPYL